MIQRVSFKITLVLFIMVSLLGLATSAVSAQSSKLPGFSVPRDDDSSAPKMPLANLNAQMFANYETAFLKLRNRMLSDTLLLQYQISLLKILIKRQGEIDNIAKSFGELNINFNQPAPDKSICERLPENLLCVLYYPEIFDIDVEAYTNPPLPPVVMAEPVAATPATAQQQNNPSATTNSNTPSIETYQEEEEEEVTSPYFWSDIQCAAGYCKVLLVDAENSGRNFTARTGEKLPDDSILTQISFNGVKVNKKGESLTVEPAPANGVVQTRGRGGAANNGAQAAASVSNILQNAGVNPPARSTTNNNASTNQDSGTLFDNMPAPAETDTEFTSDNLPAPETEPSVLGPTGLF